MSLPTFSVAPSDRIYETHSSGMGVVMTFKDTIVRHVLVLFAKYRSVQRFGAFDLDFPGETPRLRYNPINLTFDMTDRYLNENYAIDPRTSKENCSLWMTLNDKKDEYFDKFNYIGVPAVSYCRSILVDGVPCDLPNIQTLMRIYCDRDTIDSMDPTLSEYPTYALGLRNPQGDWTIGPNCLPDGDNRYVEHRYSWSSTEYNSGNCWCVGYIGGVFGGYGKDGGFSVLPVLEL